MQKIILSIQNGEKEYTRKAAARILYRVVDRISETLKSLVTTIEDSIPLASRGSELGKDLAARFLKENNKLQKLRADTPLWRFLLDSQSWSGRQLARDLEMTSESVRTVTTISMKLEDLRATMVTFRNNLILFKVRVAIKFFRYSQWLILFMFTVGFLDCPP